MRIVPTSEVYIAAYRTVLDTVARERKYLGFTEAPTLDATAGFVHRTLADDGVHMLAITNENQVVGWCDITRIPWEGLRHVGRLGIGLLPSYRRQGYGQLLMDSAIEHARKVGVERIELEVFATNIAAVNLYKKLGFHQEGLKQNFRKLDGSYDDSLIMSLLIPSPLNCVKNK